jgi:non-canonical (house-cleaning) NTP pyrophosphatase
MQTICAESNAIQQQFNFHQNQYCSVEQQKRQNQRGRSPALPISELKARTHLAGPSYVTASIVSNVLFIFKT